MRAGQHVRHCPMPPGVNDGLWIVPVVLRRKVLYTDERAGRGQCGSHRPGKPGEGRERRHLGPRRLVCGGVNRPRGAEAKPRHEHLQADETGKYAQAQVSRPIGPACVDDRPAVARRQLHLDRMYPQRLTVRPAHRQRNSARVGRDDGENRMRASRQPFGFTRAGRASQQAPCVLVCIRAVLIGTQDQPKLNRAAVGGQSIACDGIGPDVITQLRQGVGHSPGEMTPIVRDDRALVAQRDHVGLAGGQTEQIKRRMRQRPPVLSRGDALHRAWRLSRGIPGREAAEDSQECSNHDEAEGPGNGGHVSFLSAVGALYGKPQGLARKSFCSKALTDPTIGVFKTA